MFLSYSWHSGRVILCDSELPVFYPGALVSWNVSTKCQWHFLITIATTMILLLNSPEHGTSAPNCMNHPSQQSSRVSWICKPNNFAPSCSTILQQTSNFISFKSSPWGSGSVHLSLSIRSHLISPTLPPPYATVNISIFLNVLNPLLSSCLCPWLFCLLGWLLAVSFTARSSRLCTCRVGPSREAFYGSCPCSVTVLLAMSLQLHLDGHVFRMMEHSASIIYLPQWLSG